MKIKKIRNGTFKPKGKTEDEGNASVAVESGSEGDVLVAFVGCAKIDDIWILDSACTFHIWIHKEWFNTYELVQDGDSVLMDDNIPYKIVGVGSIQIKMSGGIIRTLTEMKHIPTMMRNLILLSTLYLKGYKYSAEVRVVKISKGSLVVMKGDLKSANLYLL